MIIFDEDVGSPLYKEVIQEIKEGWEKREGKGNKEARMMEDHCVLVQCDEEDAIELSHQFYCLKPHRSSCYHDGETLSLYCGLEEKELEFHFEKTIRAVVFAYFTGKKHARTHQRKMKGEPQIDTENTDSAFPLDQGTGESG